MTNYVYFCPKCRKHFVYRFGFDWYLEHPESFEEVSERRVVHRHPSKSFTTILRLKWKVCTHCTPETDKTFTVTITEVSR